MTKEQAILALYSLAFTTCYDVFKEELNYFKYRASLGTYTVSLNINQTYTYKLYSEYSEPAGFDKLNLTLNRYNLYSLSPKI